MGSGMRIDLLAHRCAPERSVVDSKRVVGSGRTSDVLFNLEVHKVVQSGYHGLKERGSAFLAYFGEWCHGLIGSATPYFRVHITRITPRR